MPKRKRGITGDAQRRRRRDAERERRENENESEAENRRAAARERRHALETTLNEDEVSRRRSQVAQHSRQVRSQETEDEANRRRSQVAQHNRQVRSQETEDEANRRRSQVAQHNRQVRSQETEDEANRRRSQVAQHSRQVRSQETEDEANRRRSQVAQHSRQIRSQETEDEANRRRSQVALHSRQIRSQETEDETDRRRNEDAEQHRQARSQETRDEANRRRSQVAEQHREARSQETIDAHEDRLINQRVRRGVGPLHNIARASNTVDVQVHSCSSMNDSCPSCGGLFFSAEKTVRGRYKTCCRDGTIIEPQRDFPQVLKELFTGDHVLSGQYFKNIRHYNSLMSFASLGANVDVPPGSGPFCYRIHGAIYHKTGHLRPPRPGQEKYAQLYILDSDQALRQRMNMASNVRLNEELLRLLDSLIRDTNPYAQAYRMLKEFEEEALREGGPEASADIRMYIKGEGTRGEHRGRYNAPKENEVAAVFKSTDGAAPSNRDIVIHPRGGGLVNINTLNPNLEPMTYVLFFPFGEPGFEIGHNYTELQFYAHRASVREGTFNAVLYGRKLFQQYLVDNYVKIEGNRLSYIKMNQKKLRVDTYMGLADHIYRAAEEIGARPGIPVILPSSFIGSPRYMQQNYQDAMAIVRDFGKPDLFLTFTCNPKWPEITENLFPGQKAQDRPDIVSRVFDLKKKALLDDILKFHILGKIVAHVLVIEFQKRGLPHMHLLLILEDYDKITDSDCIDSLVCAELPDASVDPILHNVITSAMIHGPCGQLNRNSPCMVDGACSKGYPKDFQEVTKENVGGYPLYRRRSDGNCIVINNNVIDNRWVVPYNPYLCKKYGTHINLEVCSSVKSVKYLFKYVYKGHDAANVVLEQSGDATLRWDEIKSFLNCRYISAPEAAWRVFEKTLHAKSHSIYRLPVHLKDLQPVYFSDADARDALERAARNDTMLTGWFTLNRALPEANGYLYTEIPYHFRWQNHAWIRRTRLGDKIIPRMYSVTPKDVERFHLRMLLCHVRGAKSFEDVRTYEDVEYATFKEACRARNLLQDDQEWKNCLREASTFQMPPQLRQLFAFICIFCNCTEPVPLWEEFKDLLAEDFLRTYSAEVSYNLTLQSIEKHLTVHNISLASLNLPQPSNFLDVIPLEPLYDVQAEVQKAEEMKNALNREQRFVYDQVLESVCNTTSVKTFCLNAFAGAGKTFLFKAILHAVRGMGFIATPVAWTGIAAVLLEGGKTAHSTFKLPIPVLDNSSCHVRHDSPEGLNLKNTKLIIWDECTMTPHYALEAVDRLLRDLTGNDIPFGGKTVLLGGDWRQTLPVVRHGNKASALENCLKNSYLWPHFKQLALTTNMRLEGEQREFSEWLLKLGDGRLENDCDLERDIIEVPAECVVQGSIVDAIFGAAVFDFQDLASKAILCPKNDASLKLNETILARFPGENVAFYSADTIVCDDPEEQENFQMDFIHSLTPSGMPPHCLNLKVGAVIMLLRNLNASIGLCNGTRLIIKTIMQNFLDCEVVTGENAGTRVFIPRMQLSPSDSNLPFQLSRRQFPVRLSFAMTINKAQGQTLKKVGIFLPQTVFSHGMLYVAFSRCSSMNGVRVSIIDRNNQGRLILNSAKTFTKNIVYRQVLDD